jgi:DNA-binding NtrC family response regulator
VNVVVGHFEKAGAVSPMEASSTADVLVVEDRASLRTMLRRTLQAKGYTVHEAGDTPEALAFLATSRVSVVLTDLRLPRGSGMDVLKAAREADANLPVIVMTAFGTIEDAVSAMKDGAFDFLSKPVDTDHLTVLTERAIEQRRLLMENLILKEEYAARYGFPQIIGVDSTLEEVSRATQRAAAADATVLLMGESGTGKELFARALHHLSPRREGPFLAINCAAIPEPLLENELFGHEKGAFTGAIGRKMGKLELADHGTVLLDEVGELPLSLQSKLLRVLQEHAFERVGGTTTVHVDVRIVAATNRDLRRAVDEKLFRDDLFYRLSVFPIDIPPLRNRRGDIPLLATHFVERFCRELGKPPMTVAEETMNELLSHHWPGNVRELANCLERAVILSDGRELTSEVLGFGSSREVAPPPDFDLSGSLAEVSRRAASSAEKKKIRCVMEEVGGDRPRAAEKLEISPKTLLAKLREYGLVNDFERYGKITLKDSFEGEQDS